MKNLALLASVLSFCCAAPLCSASVITYSGTYSATFNTGAANYQGVSVLSGTWSFNFDNSGVPTVGAYEVTVPLQSATTVQLVGATAFNTINTSARLSFNDGSYSVLVVGGTVETAGTVSGVFDDFSVVYVGASPLSAVVSASTVSGVQSSSSISGNLTAVPEPSSGMLAAAAVGLAVVRRRRR